MRTFTILFLLILAAGFSSAQLQATMDQGPVALKDLGKYKRALTLDVLEQLKDAQVMQALQSELNAENSAVDLVPFFSKFPVAVEFTKTAAALDREIREIKGISDKVDHLLEVRLAFPERGFLTNAPLLVSYVPAGNERSWKSIEAFDLNGNVHYLDVQKAPKSQVLVVGLNAKRDMKAGLALMNEELRKAGMQPEMPKTREDLQVAKLNYIRLNDDQEPWLLGDAEIYALVNGIAPETVKASVIAMDMPYLDKDKKDYYPNQVLIVWNNYRFKAANICFYEHDDSSNYKEIVAMLISKIGDVVPEYKFIFEIASQIIKLMPDKWFTNDDDYVDVFYTLEQGKTYKNYMGVSQNAKMTLVPYVIHGD